MGGGDEVTDGPTERKRERENQLHKRLLDKRVAVRRKKG